ncbi:MAG: kynureninase [Gaiellales bacterium]
MAVTDRAHAEALDATDPLAWLRDRYVHDDRTIYVDGNSLGRLPTATPQRIASLVEDWGTRLVAGWQDWVDLAQRAGDELAPLVGAGPGELLVCDSVTVNLYKLAWAALTQRPGAIVYDPDDFPTDRYVLAGLAAHHGRELAVVGAEPPQAALVCRSHVNYRSGELLDMPAVTVDAHERGALMVWDLCHSVGVVDIDLRGSGADLAVGCTYKYLNAGPGAPAFLWVRRDLIDRLRSPIQGWFGQADQFAMGPSYNPAQGITRFLAGTPPIAGIEAVRAGAADLLEAGLPALRRKSVELTELAVALHDARLADLGFELGSPREAARRGSHVSVRHPEAWRICRALIERAGVVPDFRGPDSIRLGLAPGYTRFTDVWDAIDAICRVVGQGLHLDLADARNRVT